MPGIGEVKQFNDNIVLCFMTCSLMILNILESLNKTLLKAVFDTGCISFLVEPIPKYSLCGIR